MERQPEFGPKYVKGVIPLPEVLRGQLVPGKFEWVNSGHEIHQEKPGVVGDPVRWVVRNGH